ncbi:MAG: hypothetical protein KC547_21180, partial [Anaerolineae bacterium]|nr:hypothetical protein [Anaerolineae bacterium]
SSPVCHLEIDYASANNKRIIPILYQSYVESDVLDALLDSFATKANAYIRSLLDGRDLRTIAQDNLLVLSRLNWVIFSDDTALDTGMSAIAEAIATDVDYIHEHTRILVRAREWDRSGRKKDYLLRGKDLKSAEKWQAQSADKKPSILGLQSEYIFLSKSTFAARQRMLIAGISTGLVVVMIFALIALYQAGVAESEANTRATQQLIAENNAATATVAQGLALLNEATSVANASTATVAQGQAENAAATAEYRSTLVAQQAATSEANLVEAWQTQSRFLADQSLQQLRAGNVQTALLLALQSVEHFPLFYYGSSQVALLESLSSPVQEIAFLQHEGRVIGASWNHDESQVLTWSMDGTARIWDLETGEPTYVMNHDGIVWGAEWASSESKVLTWANNCEYFDLDFPGDCTTHEATIWDVGSQSNPLRLPHSDFVAGAAWSPNDEYVLTWSYDHTAHVWSGTTGELLQTLAHDGVINGAKWSSRGSNILTWSHDDRTARVWFVLDDRDPLIFSHENPEAPITYLSGAEWSPDENYVLTWGTDGSIQIWPINIFDTTLIGQHAYSVNGAVWSPDGRRIL